MTIERACAAIRACAVTPAAGETAAEAYRQSAGRVPVDPMHVAHFVGQLAHESGGFIYREEIASGAAYEGRADLGNTQKGDGVRFKGRGYIQLTGRANYRKFGKLIGIDLIKEPDLAAEPVNAIRLAVAYWDDRLIWGHAERDDIHAVTRKINGGLNGLSDRERLTCRAKIALMQFSLTEAGLPVGTIDGIAGPKTRRAQFDFITGALGNGGR